MKRFWLSLFVFLQCSSLLGHGFSADTLVLLAENGWQQISALCYRVQKKKIPIASYDTVSSFQTKAPVIRGGRSQTDCYIQFAFIDGLQHNDHATARLRTAAGGFEERLKNSQHYHELECTPTQEFYLASTHQWVPAYLLKIGDELLCAHNTTKTVAYISLIKEPLEIFTVEVKHTHTFFVTQHSVLTHNMVLPIAFNIGLSIPFGASAGGTAGSFFGPATFVVGAAIGCMVGALVKMVYDGNIPQYRIDVYDTNHFEHHIKQQPITYNNEDHVSLSTTIQNPPQEKPGCGDGLKHVELSLGTPLIPPPDITQTPGCGCPPIDIPIVLINVPIEPDWSTYIHTQDGTFDKGKTEEKEDEKQKQQDDRTEKIHNHRRWTNKEAREHAKALGKGYEEKKNRPSSIKGIGFTNGKNWISPDIDSHNGCVWKEFNLKGIRTGSLDKNLNRVKD